MSADEWGNKSVTHFLTGETLDLTLVLPSGSSSRASVCFWVRELLGFQESLRRRQELSDKANPPRSASPLNSHTWKPFVRPGSETEPNAL